jgi:tetratricopeptide (TPR) repeat protein
LPASRPARTVDPEAYDAYQLGRFEWDKRTPAALRQSIEYFQQALRKDSNFAQAYAGLADSYSLLGASRAGDTDMPFADAREKAREAAQKALELDDTLAEAHAALGFVKFRYDWDWTGAEKEFRLAIQSNPGYATGYHWYALMLDETGRIDESETMIQRARSLDPRSPNINQVIGAQLARRKQYDKAIVQLLEALEFGKSNLNTHITLGLVFERKGKYREAMAEYSTALGLGAKGSAQAALGHAHAVVGERAEAEKILQELLARHAWFHSVLIYCGLGDRDEAFKYLEVAYRDHSPAMTTLLVDWRLDPLRSDPRFEDLLRRVGLPQE